MGRFSHYPKSVLATVESRAVMNLILFSDAVFGFGKVAQFVGICWELRITPFADAENWNILGSLYDSEFAGRHDCSLAQLTWSA